MVGNTDITLNYGLYWNHLFQFFHFFLSSWLKMAYRRNPCHGFNITYSIIVLINYK